MGLLIFTGCASLLFEMIIPYAHAETITLARVFIAISWGCAWVLRGVWRSSRDYTVDDMGPITLKTYIGEIIQVYKNKFEAKHGELEDDNNT
jgi:hypothetical protein